MIQNLIEAEMRENLLILDQNSTVSLGSVSFQYGYRELYDIYLAQFKNKTVTHMLDKYYRECKENQHAQFADHTLRSQRTGTAN